MLPIATRTMYFFYANTPEALKQELQGITHPTSSRLEEVIPPTAARVGFFAETPEEASAQLARALDALVESPNTPWNLSQGVYYRPSGVATEKNIVGLFSGQGSQYLNMGKALYDSAPEFQQVVTAMDSLFEAEEQTPLSKIMFPEATEDSELQKQQTSQLQSTELAQPAIGVMSAGLFRLLEKWVSPQFTIGHSFGELTALWAAGVLSESDYFRLAKARGKAMAPPEDPNFDAGVMMAVKASGDEVQKHIVAIPDVRIANYNSPNQVVIAGTKAAVTEAQQVLKAQKLRGIMLPVSAAFHTPLVQHAQQPFAAAMRDVTFQPPKATPYSNASAKPYPESPEAIREVLQQHILESVHFTEEIQNIYDAGGRIFIEYGPKNVLANLAKTILGEQPHVAIALNGNGKKGSDVLLQDALVQLKVAGVSFASSESLG